MFDRFRKCNNFKGFRTPTEREKAYIAKAAVKSYETPLLWIAIFLLVQLIFAVAAMEWLARINDMGTIFGNNVILIMIALCFFIVVCVHELRRQKKLKKGNYVVLEGVAAYRSYYHKNSPTGPNPGDITYYHKIKNFTSIHGETDEITPLLKIPDNAHVNGDWGVDADFPVLLIKVNDKVQHAIPDWEKVWKYPKYSNCTPMRKDIAY